MIDGAAEGARSVARARTHSHNTPASLVIPHSTQPKRTHTHTHNRPNQLTSSPVWFLKDISFCWAAHASRLTNSVCVTEGGRKGGGKADESMCG